MDTKEFAERQAQKVALARGEITQEEFDAAAAAAPPEEVEVEETDDTPDPAPDPAPEAEAVEEAQVDGEGRTVEEAVADAVEALPDDATEEEREAAAASAEESFYVGRYKTREEAERGFKEKDAEVTRAQQEAAELRRQLQEAQETREAEAQQVELDEPEWRDWASRQVENGAGQAGALKALQEGGWAGYDIYAQAWLSSEDEQDRAEAIAFDRAVMLERAAAVAKQEVAAATVEREEQVDVKQEAAKRIAERRPDFDRYQDEMASVLDELPEETARYLTTIAQESVEGAVHAADYLYLEAKARKAPTRAAAQAKADQEAASSAQSAKVAATLVTAEGASPRHPRSRQDELEEKGKAIRNERRKIWGLPELE